MSKKKSYFDSIEQATKDLLHNPVYSHFKKKGDLALSLLIKSSTLDDECINTLLEDISDSRMICDMMVALKMFKE